VSLLVAILALAPGIYAWWTGRALLARVEDPAFPELLLARAQRRAHIATAAAVASAFIPGTQWLWAFPVFVVALLVGGFPFRRTLYGETWSVVAYLRYALFGFVGMAGFWLTLAFAPLLIFTLVDGWTLGASPFHGAVILGAIFAAGLVAWEYAYPLLWLALHRASPLPRADLEPRFDDVVRRSGVAKRPPRVFRYGASGAYVMNAIALPSVRQPRVAFGDTLLELLTPDEIVAVFAHEVSHLEHFDRRRMLRIRLLTYLLVLGATAFPAMLLASTPEYAWTVKLVWPVIVLVLLALRASKSQSHETESDLRAAALTDDAEAMVRALTKLHHYSRMPRRWPYDFERAASHPSLARRIQALRTQGPAAASPPPPTTLGAPTVLRSTEPGAYVALDDARAYWFDGVPADASADSLAVLRELATSYRAVAYADLTELRVAVVRSRGRALLARDRTGKTWSMPIRPDDVAAAQQALDVLDIRLGNHVREDWATKARVIATLLALALVGALDFSWPWIPLIVTLVKPTRASLAAMGSMAIARVILGAIAGTLGVTALGGAWSAAWLAVVAMFGIGVWACRVAWRWTRGDERPARQPFTAATLVVLAMLLFGALAITNTHGNPSVPPLSLPSQGPAPAIATLLLGVGVAFITCRDNLRRRSGAALAVLALALGGFAVDGQRYFTRNGPGITWTTGQAELAGRVDLTGSAYRLQLSPGGQRFAVQGGGRRPARYEDDGGEESVNLWRFTIGSIAGSRRTTEALDLAFLDDDRVLALRPAAASGDSLELSVEGAESGDSTSSWRRTIPAYYAPSLSLDRTTGTWRVTGHDVTAGAAVTAVGRIGSDTIKTTRLSGALLGGRPLHTYRDGTSLITTLHGSSSSYGTRQILLGLLGFFPFRWDVWRVVDGERRSVGELPGYPECGGRDETLLCVVRGRSGVTLWQLGAGADTSPASLGALPGGLDLWDIGTDGRIAAAGRDGNTLAIVDAGLGRGTRIALGGGVRLQGAPAGTISYATDVAVGPGIVAVLVMRERKSEVTFYRVK
jgi:Zn-dependent protease with chaperone function